ncbi:hypothetical protein SPRG_02731 [Saprolegnia parasitica CBS 223.65]|uniref:PDZ domain-containing protein n=1 Tax=Saprolegnia parasitica (strain CBS 223.65) TaxID=695850 RepID=A0A067D0H4_SAPPC|nr:hypothetical protein SPRG_02731 [Saprolegnia parasitica CBS 223.65]KDO32251.1 hypothetical protein SPRG_02731 [Saprolegnia parasitica CBS 223.65]|eukprot:XP_012196708.1 hypothetical protein SPRG_02731 [Saprolegnia parasitica CBS 223.65]
MLEGYLHALLKSILGTYVDLNEESEALRVSVWEGQVELRELRLKVDAFEPLLQGLPFSVAFGCIGYFKLQVPLINLGGQPIQVHVQDVYLLLRPRVTSAPTSTASAMASATTQAAAKAYMLQAKRTTLQALELEQEKEAKDAASSPAQSTFMSRLLTKLLDNVQIQIERIHVRLEDAVSDPRASYVIGLTLDELVVKSVDASGAYTLQVRDVDAATCLRKVLEITHDDQVSRFVAQMQNCFWDENTAAGCLIEPMTMRMSLLMNDRGVNVPLPPKAFSQRVLQRLGIAWLVETHDAIGDDAWSAFVASMPPRAYTLTFVFCEAWALAQDALDLDDVPTLDQLTSSLRSCLQWPHVDPLRESLRAFHAAAVRVVQENSTFLTVEVAIDRVAWRLHQAQYHSLLALMSAVALQRRQQPYKDLRPTTSVSAHPAAWWRFAIEAVRRDNKARLATVNWSHVHAKNVQKARYKELYLLLNDGSTGSKTAGNIHWGEVMREFDDLEYAMDNVDILGCRSDAKKAIAAAKKAPTPPPSASATTTDVSMWSYGYWFGTTTTPNPTPTSPTASVQSETQYLYNAINFDPTTDASMTTTAASSIVQYRVNIALRECSFQLGSLLDLHVSGMALQLLQRAKSTEVSLELLTFVLTEVSDDASNRCCIARVPMETVLTLPEAAAMSSVKLRHCEAPLPLLSAKIELPPLDDAVADVRLTLVTQPVDARLSVPFVLATAAFLQPPATVDLHELDDAAWANAKSFTQYSAAQLRQAIAARTKLSLQVDVTSPIITIVESIRDTALDDPVRLTLYFGHLQARSHVQAALPSGDHERSLEDFVARLPDEQLHDVIEVRINGADVRLETDKPLLEQASIFCTLKTSVVPDDLTIPLIKLHGHVDHVCMHLSSVSYARLQQLAASVQRNLAHVALPTPDMAPVAAAAASAVASTRPSALTQAVSVSDFEKLMQRVVVDGVFTVDVVDVRLYADAPLVRLHLGNMTSHIVLRSFDRRLEFGLGSLCVDDYARPLAPTMVSSSADAQSLIRVALTMVSLDRPLPPEAVSPDVWATVAYPQAWGSAPIALLQPALQYPVSVDVALDGVHVHVHRDTLSRLLLFFAGRPRDDTDDVRLESPVAHVVLPEAVTSLPVLERQVSARAIPLPPSQSSYGMRSDDDDDSASYRTACAQTAVASPTYLETLRELVEPAVRDNTPWLQVQLQFKSFQLTLPTEDEEGTVVAAVAVEGLYVFLTKSPTTLALAASLRTARIVDGAGREMFGADVARSMESATASMHHAIHRQSAMVTMAYDAFGTEAFEESWHPGYASGISLCLRSPHVCFLYRFLLELQSYATTGPLVETLAQLASAPTSQDAGLSVVDAQDDDSDVSAVSTFPSIQIEVHDSVLEMPRDSSSKDAITLRLDALRVSNGPAVTDMDGHSTMDKVLRNARLTTLAIDAAGVRVVTTIHDQSTSLLGGTRFDLVVDLAHGTSVTIQATPIRFVCSQEQYAFLLSAPSSNVNEVPKQQRAPTSSYPRAAPAPPASYLSIRVSIPELSMELCNGDSGYQPTSTGDLSMATLASDDVASMARLHLRAIEASLISRDSALKASLRVREVVVSDSRRIDAVAPPYRSLIALRHTDDDGDALVLTVAHGNDRESHLFDRVASPEARPGPDDDDDETAWRLDVGLYGLSFYPSPLLRHLSQFFVPVAPRSSADDADETPVTADVPGKASMDGPYPAVRLRFTCAAASVVLVENLARDDSRLLRLQWHASLTVSVDTIHGVRVDVMLSQVQASSKLLELEADGILKPITIHAGGAYIAQTLVGHVSIDQVIVLRCGYMDYTTLFAALAALSPPPPPPTATSTPVPEAAPVTLPSHVTSPPAPRRPVRYGDARIKFVLFTPRGYFQSKDALGYYSGHWRKYIMMPPVPSGYEASFEEMTFTLLPAPSNDASVGDTIRFGDAVVLQDRNGTFVAKYDALGASGYLGPEGGGGRFECRLWQAGTTIFNADRTAVHYSDSVELEGVTLYDPNPAPVRLKEAAAQRAHATHGGYLMFNGMGDAPVVFALHSQDDDDDDGGVATDDVESDAAHPIDGLSDHFRVVSAQIAVPGVRLTVLNDMNNMHLPLLHAEVVPIAMTLQTQRRRASLFLHLGMNLQAYNRRLAVWEPILEEFPVHVAYHAHGGVVCDVCLYEDSVLACPSTPQCAIPTATTHLFTSIARRAFETKQQIQRDLLQCEASRPGDTLLLTVPSGIALNVSRNNLHVLFHGLELFTQHRRQDSARAETFGSNVYVDNQSGVPLAYAMVDTVVSESTESGSRLQWTPVLSGSCVPTSMLAHEAPAGIVMAPMRRLLWLKYDKKPMLVPIEHGHKSCFQFHPDQPLLGETVAEKGTLILRIRSAVQLRNLLGVPVDVHYDTPKAPPFLLSAGASTYVPVQALKDGYVTLCPRLDDGQLDPCLPLAWRTLVAAAKKAPHEKAKIGHIVDTVTFFWRAYPSHTSGGVHLPPYNMLVVASSADLDRSFSLHAPLSVENLLPWPATYYLLHESKDGRQEIAMGAIDSGSCASMCVVDMRQDVSIALSLAVPSVELPRSTDLVWIFGPKLANQRQYATLGTNCVVVVDLCDPLQTSDRTPHRDGPVACRLYAEYWFIDRSDLGLHFDTPSTSLLPQRLVAPSPDEAFFVKNPLTMASMTSVVSAKVLDGSAQWTSTAIDLSAVGTRAPLSLHRTHIGLKNVGTRLSKHLSSLMGIAEEKPKASATTEFALGVRLDQGPGRFSRTTVVTFTPRYLLVNKSVDATLEVTQSGSRSVTRLAPCDQAFFHWESDHDQKVQVRWLPTGGGRPTMWTHAFEMAVVGDFMLKMHAPPPTHDVYTDCGVHDHPTAHMLHVAIQLQEPMLVVVLHAAVDSHPDVSLPIPYIVRNDCTRFRVVLWQKQDASSHAYQSLDVLPPLTSLAYVPDVPRNNPTVCLQLQSTLLSSSPMKELELVPHDALVNIEVTFDKPHRLPVIQVGKRRVWVDMLMDGTTKSIVITDMLPGTSEAHTHKRQSMLLKDWKHILRRLAQTAQVLAPIPSSVAWPETIDSDRYALCLYVLEARRLGSLLPTTRETFRPFVKIHLHGRSKEVFPQKQAISPIWLPQETDPVRGALPAAAQSVLRLEVRDADAIFGSTLLGYCELELGLLCDSKCRPTTLDVWCPLTSSVTGMPSSASVHLLLSLSPSEASMIEVHEEVLIATLVRADVAMALGCRDRFQLVLEAASLDVADLESSADGDRRSLTSFSTATSTASDDTLLDEKKQLSVVVLHVSSPLPLQLTHNYYCAIESDVSTRCTTPVLPKDDAVTPTRRETPVVLDFLGGHALGLDLVYADGHVHIHGVDCDGQSGLYYKDGRIRIGDRVQAVNRHTILNLSKDAAFAAIEAARSDAAVFTLTLAPTTTPDDAPVVDIEWNRRLIFADAKADGYLKVRFYERLREKDHGVSEEKEASVLPFLYFFGEDAILDDLDHSKQHRQTDTLIAICWVRIPDDDDDWVRVEHAHERICALYQFLPTSTAGSELRIVGHLRIALKWELVKPLDEVAPSLSLYAQIDVGPVFVSLVDLNEEVLCASLTGSPDVPGIQVSYGVVSDNRQVINVRLDHVQLDNQLVDTNYPVTLAPVRQSGSEAMPTVQFMAVVNVLPAVMHFEYIFAQLQELEIKVEDFLLVAIARVFSNIDWSFQAPALAPRASSVYALLSAQNLVAELHITDSMLEENKKVVLRWLLLCPIRLNVTFSSTTDQPLTHSILSPQMSPLLRNIIGAATALVTNLDRAPIEIPEFYIESVFETKYALGFYVMQHYLHYGLRSWYKIVGSVDVLGNPIGLVSTLGTGVRDFFFTPAQMLLEDESGLRIENLRTGMTKGSKSLLRNTAVGIFHTTGKITETLGKGIAMLAMDNEYNTQRQQRALKQATTISHLGDGILEGGKDLAGGIWEGVRGVVVEPVVGAANDGAGGFIVGLGKGFAGLLVKPTAGVLDLLTSVSHGVKVTAESMDARLERRGSSRVRLPRRFGSDGVLVAYSEREAKGSALMLLTGLEDEYVYHVEYGDEANRGLVLLTNKRITCLAKGHPLWELALDSTLVVEAVDQTLRVTAAKKLYTVPCHASPRLFQVAVEHLRGSSGLQETRYVLLNLEKKGRSTEASVDGSAVTDPGAEKVVLELSATDLQSQPIRSIRVELCHIDNKDARARVPHRPSDVLASFSVFRLLVLGGPYQWTVFRRFSEFRELHETLQQLVDMTSLPPLPPRHLFFSTRASIVKARQDALSVYLQAVIMHPPILHAAEMQLFLTHDASDVHVAHVGLL